MKRRRNSRNFPSLDIPTKANRVLNIILIALVLIVLRVWHLTVIQYEDRLELARRPQRKVVVEPAKRGTIRDRFNLPLAINKIQYNAAVVYSQIRQIPSIHWEKKDGVRVKSYQRREYITQLSKMLADELGMDWERVEDLIHAKASLYNQVPFVLKEDISEQQYYRLKMLEKDWLGVHVQPIPKRYYPNGEIASDILGYMGAISREEYDQLMQELNTIQRYVQEREEGLDPELPPGFLTPAEAWDRLKELQEHAYTINDYVGKSGIEGRFEEDLRGFYGKRSYYSDARGNYLRELPGSVESLSGQRLLLSISLELQRFAENLLIQNESVRPIRVSGVSAATQEILALRQPWIKGGAIVAMDPNTGEVIALAAHPRFDPNDFIASGDRETHKQKQKNIHRWFETESYLGDVWDRRRDLEREREGGEEVVSLTWEKYIDFILPSQNQARKGIERIKTVRNAITLQRDFEKLLKLSNSRKVYGVVNELYPTGHYGDPLPALEKERLLESFEKNEKEIRNLKKRLDRFFADIEHNYDKVLLMDLCRLAVDANRFSDALLKEVGDQSILEYREISSNVNLVLNVVREMTKELFHDLDFKKWREENEKDFLKEKREEEVLENRYAKPYIDLLDQKEQELFQQFWDRYRWDFVLAFLIRDQTYQSPYIEHFSLWHKELAQGAHASVWWREAFTVCQRHLEGFQRNDLIAYLMTLRSFSDLHRPLYGSYLSLRGTRGQQTEKHLAMGYYPKHGFGYARSHAYRQASTQGSLFKLVTAYEALRQHIERHSSLDLNPMVMVDQYYRKGNASFVGYTQSGKEIPQLYKGGRLPKSHTNNIGEVDLPRAIETSSNPYFSLLASEFLEDPEDLANAARAFSFGSKTGIDLLGEYPGSVPNDLDFNLTGLYSMAIGQHSLVVTPLQSAVMMSAMATKGKVIRPKIVKHSVGKPRERSAGKEVRFPYQEPLQMVGLDFQPFSALDSRGDQHLVRSNPTDVKYEIDISPEIHSVLTNGMQRVMDRITESGLPSLSKMYEKHPEAISDLIDMKESMIGKSSTAESVESCDLDLDTGRNTYCHLWFGGITFEPENRYVFRDRYGNPELVVIVYLRYGAWGKDAAPLAAQVAHKWREIQGD